MFGRQLTDISGSGASGDDGGLRDRWRRRRRWGEEGQISTNEGQLDIESYLCHDGGERGRKMGKEAEALFFQAGSERDRKTEMKRVRRQRRREKQERCR